MFAKINDELARHLEGNVALGNPAEEIPIIVTVKEWDGTAELEHRGLRIGHTFETACAVSGKAFASDVARIAALENVVLVEYDGEMRTP